MKMARFLDWPLRVKMATLLLVVSLLPLVITAFGDIRETQERLLSSTGALLAARGDQLVSELDGFNRVYSRSVDEIARGPDIVRFFQVPPDRIAELTPGVRAALGVYPASDPSVHGVALLDLSGTVRVATEEPLAGKNLAYHGYFQEALRGAAVISDIHLAEPEVSEAPTIVYLAPVLGPDRTMIGLVALRVRATALWDLARSSNGLAGPGSFGVLFDHQGIRVAHTYNDDIVFHPGGPLDAPTVSTLVAERRFGARTRQLLEDVRAFPQQFDRARSESPDRGLFRGFAPVNQQWNYGVGRRMVTAPWTLFYMIPEKSIDAQIEKMTREKTLLAGVIILGAVGVGAFFAATILRPVLSLAHATEELAKGDRSARVSVDRADEFGELGAGFNRMAEQLEAQAAALEKARDELEMRVEQRTAELAQITRNLALEVDERRRAEEAVRESEQRLATTLHSIGDAVIATDMEGRVLRMNPVAEQLTGWPLEEAKGRPLAEVFRLLNEEDRRPVENPADRVLRDGVVVGLANHTALVSRDGRERPIADSGAPIRDEQGRTHGVVVVFRDMTEERAAEAALRERHEVILRQQQAIAELSTPVLRLRDGLLILPLIGLVDTPRARQINEGLLAAIHDSRARVVVIDITGVPVVDSEVADHVLRTVRSARLMGVKVIVTGLSASVAQALTNLDVDLESLTTQGDLQGGIEWAERLLGYRTHREGRG
jgi:PAS domain S-box-containing protein